MEILDEATINNMEGLMRQALPVPSAPQAPSNPTSQFSATTDQEGDSKQKSSIKGNHSWSEESSTTKTKDNRIRVSYNREETFEQENGDKHVTAESYVKHYSETEYTKKKENKKFWKKFWNQLNWILTTLALVGTLYIAIFGCQQTGDTLYANCNQTINNKQVKIQKPKSTTDQEIKWDSSSCSSQKQTQSNLVNSVSHPGLAPNKAANRPPGRQAMTLTSSQQSVGPSNQNDTVL